MLRNGCSACNRSEIRILLKRFQGQRMVENKPSVKIMVVDDDPEYCRLLEQCFKGLGYTVRVASSGKRAMEEIGEFLPDLVLLDVMMPGDDGFSVCRQIRSQSEFAETIIIMFTSQSELEDKLRGIDSGANDYVVKPSGLGELFEVVARVNRFLDMQKEYRRRLEEEKFITLRGAANTVCHEINNPLTSIVGHARLLGKQMQELNAPAEMQSAVESILQATQRIQTITHRLSRAIRVVTTEPVPGIKMIDLSASAKKE
jgi:DNA-binding response OmpR family regulator